MQRCVALSLSVTDSVVHGVTWLGPHVAEEERLVSRRDKREHAVGAAIPLHVYGRAHTQDAAITCGGHKAKGSSATTRVQASVDHGHGAVSEHPQRDGLPREGHQLADEQDGPGKSRYTFPSTNGSQGDASCDASRYA